ncbi:cornifelin homolog B-like [Hypomesus transpacificus]|uniref:cornifelin homolog B-like n=1 Tax=Hypomesus transpacificus TaxID=137520 RepID=UPI001F07809C|nr:cornifelin homolog B-like [Hypomesus transpacificus]
MAMSVVTTQPGMALLAPGVKTEMWTSGICDCFEDMQTCCLGFWCPCCLACQVTSGFGESHCLPLLDCISGGMISPTTLALRSSLRERYRIQGSIADDCCMIFWCSSCSWCQMARELKARRTAVQQTTTTTTFLHHASPGVMYPPQQPYGMQATPGAEQCVPLLA